MGTPGIVITTIRFYQHNKTIPGLSPIPKRSSLVMKNNHMSVSMLSVVICFPSTVKIMKYIKWWTLRNRSYSLTYQKIIPFWLFTSIFNTSLFSITRWATFDSSRAVFYNVSSYFFLTCQKLNAFGTRNSISTCIYLHILRTWLCHLFYKPTFVISPLWPPAKEIAFGSDFNGLFAVITNTCN
jgi:hypothetical protein